MVARSLKDAERLLKQKAMNFEEEKSTFDYSSPTSPTSVLQRKLDKLKRSKDLANPAEHMSGF